MHFPRLAIVDLETTGADPSRDRITEIAILVVEDGELIEQWSSLVNPGMPIPERIQELIGITDAMVADAPGFSALAESVREKLANAVFVAHNARFDYNFLRAAFEQLGLAWDAPVMCSVKFSRALDPEFAKHGLDAIIARHGYTIDARHRALDDARIVWQFLQDARGRADSERLQRAWDKAFATSSVPRLPIGDLEALPDSPGAYVFRSTTGQVLEIGRARDLRSQVLGFFTAGRASAKNKKIAAAVHDVASFPCAGEFGAQLKELQLARELREQPATAAFGWRWLRHSLKAPVLELADLSGTDPAGWTDISGCFRGEREARTALQELARQHKLCASRIGLEVGGGPCQAVHLGRCHGVCVGREDTRVHDLRLATVMAALRLTAWPWRGAVLLAETHEGTQRSEVQVFDHWCRLGSACDETTLAELLASPPPRRFDADVYRMLTRWLNVPGNQARIQPL
ncbi:MULTISPECIES: exonuclease domain-containing protein [unclassified Uliginosibacterium]|uniref:exonuclease domain-containing protein n=1 Tax=unclassified Uliginosibacterium TaxID=2621521 RepID=UPI000C7AB9C6|nr:MULTISPECIES: exonuclease domain-containing protein [unclassified Uliginosibacterium]MDO6388245.1 exonuclease domain-containing protein [Uliginosibacterium sp. 31-12]PLK50603.1 ethanolamine utilization protein [Uliginosibacterium sp. TH139]